MKLTRNLKNIICIVLLLELVAAYVPIDTKDTKSNINDEDVLNFIVDKLSELSKKVDALDNKLISNTPSVGNWIAGLMNEYQTQVKLESISQAMNDMRQSQFERGFNLEKQVAEVKHEMEKHIEPELVEIKAQLSTLQNSMQTTIPKAAYVENAKTHIEQSVQNSQYDLANTINSFNRTLNSIANYWGPSFPDCTTALQTTVSSGVHRLFMEDHGMRPYDAYCLLDPEDEQGWTIIQRRQDGSVSFNRNWRDYKHGFGDPNGEYWLGLERIHAMTSKQKHELWIELRDHNGDTRHAKYAAFEIGNEAEKYYLKRLENFTGNAGDDLTPECLTRKFSTFDDDNDNDSDENCASAKNGAWWFNNCGPNGLNAEYDSVIRGEGISWSTWNEWFIKTYVHMAIRPAK